SSPTIQPLDLSIEAMPCTAFPAAASGSLSGSQGEACARHIQRPQRSIIRYSKTGSPGGRISFTRLAPQVDDSNPAFGKLQNPVYRTRPLGRTDRIQGTRSSANAPRAAVGFPLALHRPKL